MKGRVFKHELRKEKYAFFPVIVFVCEHGSAKSVLAAAFFNHLASERNLKICAIARGTNPDEQFSRQTILGLQKDGLTITESAPQKLSLADLETAQRLITFCEIPKEYQQKTVIESWDNISPVSENYENAQDAIIRKLEQLLKTM